LSTLTQDLARGCGRSLVIRVIATVIGLPLACILIFVPLWLLMQFDFQPWTLVVVALMWLVPMFLGIVVFPLGVVLQRKANFDALFQPLGLSGRAYQTFFRQYHGRMDARQVDVYFYRGPILEIEASTSLHTRLGVASSSTDTAFFAGLLGKQPLDFDDPALEDLTVFADDQNWVRALLAHPETLQLLRRLTALGSSLFTRQQVILRPGAFRLMLSGNRRLFRIDLTPPQVRVWLDDLLRLAQIAEALPAPSVTSELTAPERSLLKIRKQNPYLALWVGLGLIVFFLIAAAFIFAAVFLFASLTGGL
jgi:hypothetical protein